MRRIGSRSVIRSGQARRLACEAGIVPAVRGTRSQVLDPWARDHGGSTSVERGVMTCGPHHTQIHNHRYGQHPMPNGKIRFVRRT